MSDERIEKTCEEQRDDVEDDEVSHVVGQVETSSQFERTSLNVCPVCELLRSTNSTEVTVTFCYKAKEKRHQKH